MKDNRLTDITDRLPNYSTNCIKKMDMDRGARFEAIEKRIELMRREEALLLDYWNSLMSEVEKNKYEVRFLHTGHTNTNYNDFDTNMYGLIEISIGRVVKTTIGLNEMMDYVYRKGLTYQTFFSRNSFDDIPQIQRDENGISRNHIKGIKIRENE